MDLLGKDTRLHALSEGSLASLECRWSWFPKVCCIHPPASRNSVQSHNVQKVLSNYPANVQLIDRHGSVAPVNELSTNKSNGQLGQAQKLTADADVRSVVIVHPGGLVMTRRAQGMSASQHQACCPQLLLTQWVIVVKCLYLACQLPRKTTIFCCICQMHQRINFHSLKLSLSIAVQPRLQALGAILLEAIAPERCHSFLGIMQGQSAFLIAAGGQDWGICIAEWVDPPDSPAQVGCLLSIRWPCQLGAYFGGDKQPGLQGWLPNDIRCNVRMYRHGPSDH